MRVEEIAPAITEQHLSLLPRNMRALVGVVRLPAFVILVKTYGGRLPLRVPKEASPDCELWELIGPEALRALVGYAGGDRIEIAKCYRAAIELRNRQIRHEYFVLGHTQDELAMRYGLVVRQIRKICHQIASKVKAADEMNLALF